MVRLAAGLQPVLSGLYFVILERTQNFVVF
jgi:hypothetical protein